MRELGRASSDTSFCGALTALNPPDNVRELGSRVVVNGYAKGKWTQNSKRDEKEGWIWSYPAGTVEFLTSRLSWFLLHKRAVP